MSCLNLKLPPAKRAWQCFTSKLHNKLHRLHKSKAITKSKYRFKSPSAKPSRHDQKRRRLLNGFRFARRRSCQFHFLSQKKAAPVYIDKLFREPVADEMVAEFPPRAMTIKFMGEQVLKVAESDASKDQKKGSDQGGCGVTAAADDMWESLGFASPQMRGIDERAEQFIASFRAEMEVQEMMASELFLENGNL